MPDGRAIGPAKDVAQWSVNYIVQRSIARELGLDLGAANLQVVNLTGSVTEKNVALKFANTELKRWKDGYNECQPALDKLLLRIGPLKTWAWIGKGTALVVVVVAIVKGVMYLTRPLP